MPNRVASFALLISAFSLVACGSSAPNGLPSNSGGAGSGGQAAGGTGGAGGGTGGSGGTTAPDSLSCGGVFECAAGCAENDEVCENACYDSGSPAAKAAVDGVVTCWTNFNCSDASCLEANCVPELQACLTPTTSQPPPGGPPPAGNIPAEFVGQWAEGGWSQSADTITFAPDGQISRLRQVTFGVCQSTSDETGVATADGATLELTFTQGHFVICQQESDKTEPYQEIYSYTLESVPVDTWYPMGVKLHVIQQSCSACADQYLAKIN